MAPKVLTARAFPPTFVGAGTALDKAWGMTYDDRLRGAGGFSLNIQNDDTAGLAVTDFGAVIQMRLDNVPVFAGIVEERIVRAVAPGEERDQYTEIAGRGTLALNDSWAVYPERPVSETISNTRRLFNFSSFNFDDSDWTAAVEIEQGLGDPGGPREGFPIGLPVEAQTAWWIQSEANDIDGSVPAGDQYYRSPNLDVVGGRLTRIFISADNSHELYHNNELLHVDSVAVAGGVGWAGVKVLDRYLQNGQHRFGVKVANVAGADPNPSGFIFACVNLTNSGATLGTPVLVSDDSWLALGYPASEPGFTLGRILELLLTDAAVRGVIVPALGFTDELDSNGNPWADTPDISVGIGTKGMAFLATMAEAYLDLAMDPDTFTLRAYPKGERGTASGVTFAAGTNIARLSHALRG